MFLEIKSLFFAYPGKNNAWILSDYNFEVEAGERVGIAGPSGKGKSTLLRIIAGLEQPQKGSIVIDGCVVNGNGIYLNPEERQVGMVFQDYGLFPHMTVKQNIAYGLYRLGRLERCERIDIMLELIQMKNLAARYPYQISGGQQQRVAIARALAPNPKLLLLDEPLSNLDTTLKKEIRIEMQELMKQTGVTCIFVSHDLDELQVMCNRIEQIK